MTRLYVKGAPYDRLMAKVMFDPMAGCWIFTGATSNGYAVVGVVDRERGPYGTRTLLGHRLSYETNIGPIPDGLVLDHLCGNRVCPRSADGCEPRPSGDPPSPHFPNNQRMDVIR